MSLRAKILTYLVVIHLVLGGLALFALIDRPWLLLARPPVFVKVEASTTCMPASASCHQHCGGECCEWLPVAKESSRA